MNATQAIALHMEWRLFFLLGADGHAKIDAPTYHRIHFHKDCAIGRWLLSPDLGHLRGTREYLSLNAAHLEFHREMESLAQVILAGDRTKAHEMLAPESGFQRASQILAAAILAFDFLQPMAVPAAR